MQLKTFELKKDFVYRKIMEMIIRDQIPDGKFPSEPEFCKQLGVSRVTLRSALQRLTEEGVISRSHYYGTRVISPSGYCKKLLLAYCGAHDIYDKKIFELKMVEKACRDLNIGYEIKALDCLQDAQIISSRYFGIIFWGARINGREPFLKVIRDSGLPAIHCREDENCLITESYSSIGIEMKNAWYSGFDYLISLGMRRIVSLIYASEGCSLRFGFTPEEFANSLREKNFNTAADMVIPLKNKSDFEKVVHEKILPLKPEAIYCSSDFFAVPLLRILKECGKKVPKDIAVLGFGYGSEITSPPLSAVRITSPAFGTAVMELLKHCMTGNTTPQKVVLPYSIFDGESAGKVNLANLVSPVEK